MRQRNVNKIRYVILILVLFVKIGTVIQSNVRRTTIKVINPRVRISAERAKEIIFSHAGVERKKSRIVKLILNREEGIYLYEVIFFTEDRKYEYRLDANNGRVVNVRQSERNEHQKQNPGKGFFFGLF